MRTETIKLYSYCQLSDEAQEAARYWFLSACANDSFYWIYQEANDSREAFLNAFDFTEKPGPLGSLSLEYWDIYNGLDISELSHVRLWKFLQNNYISPDDERALVDLAGNCPFTGVVYDEILLDGIRAFLRSPDHTTFQQLIYECLQALDHSVDREIQYQLSEEAIAEYIEANCYEFTADGKVFD